MKTCPTCSSQYKDQVCFCPLDKTPLTHESGERHHQGKSNPSRPDSISGVETLPGQVPPPIPAAARSKEAPRRKRYSGVMEPGTELGAYRLLSLLGEGGMGRVYLAEHSRLGRKVALKVLRSEYARNPSTVRRFFREAQTVNQINHPHIVEITDFIENDDGDNYYIMELLRGETLGECLAREGALLPRRALHIASQICEAVSAIHGAGIVHRDLKPENVFLTEQYGQKDFVKLLDFGVVKLTEVPDSESLSRTSPGAVIGTPEYMSPEQAAGKVVDLRSDIYSLGILFYEMITGKKPMTGKSFGELVIKHLTLTPVRPARIKNLPHVVPPRLDALIMRCLKKRPDQRPQMADEVLEEIEAILPSTGDSLDQFVRSGSFTGPAERSRSRALLVKGAGMLGLVAAVVLGVILISGSTHKVNAPTLPVAALPQAVPDIPSKVQITFESNPPGAEVVREGTDKVLGHTPTTLSFYRSRWLRTFELRREGYQATHIQASLQKDTRLVVTLAKTQAPVVPTAAGAGSGEPTRKVTAVSSGGSRSVPESSAPTVKEHRKRRPAEPGKEAGRPSGSGRPPKKEKKLDIKGTLDPFAG